MRPIYHRLEDRTRAHIVLCWLTLLLVRIASVRTRQTWSQVRAALERIYVGEFVSRNGNVLQRTELTAKQERLIELLELPKPPVFLAVTPSGTKTQS